MRRIAKQLHAQGYRLVASDGAGTQVAYKFERTVETREERRAREKRGGSAPVHQTRSLVPKGWTVLSPDDPRVTGPTPATTP